MVGCWFGGFFFFFCDVSVKQKLIFYTGISEDVSLEGAAFRESLKALGVNMTLLLVSI